MNTPIADFVESYNKNNILRLHMPGHKGKGPLGIEYADITEVKGADVLSEAKGIIGESEKNASRLFMSGATYYSTEGSSLCVKAMLAAALSANGKSRRIIAARNVHKSFVYGAALLDIDVEWIYPAQNGHLCSCKVDPTVLRHTLKGQNEPPAAVYVTSPDYLGNMQDIKALAEVCCEFSVPLLVDNAHGAYTAFLESSMHPIVLGAAMCCDSAHKTLPVLTGGAYLHVSKDFPSESETIRNSMALFGSTSPSYLILQSLDLCNKYLAEEYKGSLSQCVKNTAALRQRLSRIGWATVGDEPLKITVDCATSGINGNGAADYLRGFGIEPEFSDSRYVVLMFTPSVPAEGFEKVSDVFRKMPRRERRCAVPEYTLAPSKRAMSVREAILGPQRTVPVTKSAGLICGTPVISCPPAVPIVISGEIITDEAVGILLDCGITQISVVCN